MVAVVAGILAPPGRAVCVRISDSLSDVKRGMRYPPFPVRRAEAARQIGIRAADTADPNKVGRDGALPSTLGDGKDITD